MRQLTKEDKLDFILKKVSEENYTGYYLAKKTGLTEAGINKILSGEIKRPHNSTINTLYEFICDNNLVKEEDAKIIQQRDTIIIDGHELDFTSVEMAIYKNREKFTRKGRVVDLIVKDELNTKLREIIEENNLKVTYTVKE